MSELRKANTDRAFFVTLTVVGWINVFTRREHAEELVASLKYCQKNKGLIIYAFVIMPSHIHMIARQEEGRLNEVLKDVKSFTAKRILKSIEGNQYESRREWMLYLFRYFGKKSNQNKEYMFWQKANHPTELFSNAVIDQKVDYIHNNPVVAGIVTEAESYMYSSANRLSDLKVEPV